METWSGDFEEVNLIYPITSPIKMNYILETERLTLRELTLEDRTFIVELVNSPGWIKYIGDRNIKTDEQAKSYLENGPIKSYKENGFGLWLVETKDTKKSIGMCGLLKRDYLDHPDIGFAFLPGFIGMGFGFEAANATMSFASDQLKLSSISAITLPANNASIRLLEKIGMNFMKSLSPPGNHEELHLYQVTFFEK